VEIRLKLKLAEEVFVTRHGTVTRSFEETVAAAQVHATLALAAATALGSPADNRAWADVAGSRLSGPGPEPGPRH
jgi:hypothetical protein